MGHSRFGRPRRALRRLGSLLAAGMLAGSQLLVPVTQAAVIPTASAPAAAPAAAGDGMITFTVKAARSEPRAFGGAGVTEGTPVTTYKWMINEDNTGENTTRTAAPGSPCSAWVDAPGGTPNTAYPDSCHWTSISGLRSSAPVAAQGSTSSAGGTTTVSLAPGRYLVSVLADGYKLDGSFFTVTSGGSGTVDVPLQPVPLPTATIKAQIFADVTSTNGQYDPGEDGLPGFAGFITDYIGQVTTDVFGNPLCTKYQFTDTNGNGIQDPGEQIVLDATFSPIVTHLGGKCLSGDINMDGVVNATDVSLYTDAQLDPGVLTIPNLGPNRYALSAVPPTGSSWVQTTTLEGNHDWDAWVMEGSTGLDTEFVVAGEPFPAEIFGYVPGPSMNRFASGGTGTIKGVVDAMKVFVPTTGGACLPGTIWGGLCGGKVDKPIDKPWIALSDLNNNDAAVWLGRGNANGTFTIPNVPAGSYSITYWDDPQNYILDLQNVTVSSGETVDMGVLPLTGWFTKFDGYVFDDANRNGVKDPGEKGVPDFTLTLRKRENSLMDRGATLVTTNASGYYVMENAYPLTEWLVLEAYNDRYYTTGVTYQADNQPTPTTVLGAGVDVSVLPIIGLSGQLDWGVHFYDPTGANGIDPQNGGIVGSVSYDTTRNELNPQYAVAEDWQPGVSGLTVDLYAPVDCPVDPTTGTSPVPCDAAGNYALDPSGGSYAHGRLLNTYVTETWDRPTDCIARGVDGAPLQNPSDQQVLPVGSGKGCLEGPLMGVQFGPYPTDQGTSDANFGAAVDGNYGFGDGCFVGALNSTDPSNPTCTPLSGSVTTADPTGLVLTDAAANFVAGGVVPGALVTNTTDGTTGSTGIVASVDSATQITLEARLAGGAANAFAAGDAYTIGGFQALPGDADYLVHVDLTSVTTQAGAPVYNVTREEDINIASGDSYVPQVPPPSCAGPLHTVDLAGSGTDGYGATTIPDPSGLGSATVSVPASSPVDNPTFNDIGGTPFEGLAKPLCDTKLVRLHNGKSVVPGFNVFTDVPLPSRFFALNNDDLTFSTDPKSLLYGEKAGIPFSPVGIYDFANRLVTTSETDYNGLFDVLLPSTDRISCPTPSGVCGNVYRFVGNDPGVPGRLNLNYNPQYRTIAAEFEAWPGIIIPADTAPTQVGVNVQIPGSQTFTAVSCPVNDPAAAPATRAPEFYAVSRPYGSAGQSFTITGLGFGATQGSGSVKFDGVPVPANWYVSWSDTQIAVSPQNYSQFDGGPHQLSITNSLGKTTVDGLTYHYIRTSGGTIYNPTILEVGPGKTYAPAETLPATADHAIQRALDAAPAGALVVVYPNNPSANPRQNPRGAYYENLIISKRVKLQGVGPGSPDGSVRGTIIDGGAFAGDSPVATDWYTKIGTLTWAGNQTIYDGAVISLYLSSTAFPTTYSATTAPSIDGFDLRGGDQQGFPGNINAIGGGPTGAPGGLITQGGAIFANAYARNLQITNNVVQNNGGAYGTIRIGTPDLPAPDTNNENDGVRIANNRIIANAGTNLAGGIGIFAGADGYAVSGNDICGNFSAEYGGGLSVYGSSPNGSIDHNRIYYNQSYDEAGGIMIAGQLPADPSILSPGTGAVSIHENLVQSNLANDDGGGIRFLMAGNFPMNVYNNMIVNNVSTHEGGGIAIDDAPNVRVYNNTIMKNVTTATAVTSDGTPAPAGLSTGANSALLQATLPAGSPTFSNPLLFNDIFWDNRAGTRAGATVTGIGAAGDATAINTWDIGVTSGNAADVLAPTNSIIAQNAGTHPYITSPNNSSANPAVGSAYTTALTFAPWRTNPNFVGAILVAADLPPGVLGDYHLSGTGSPAFNLGAANKAVPSYQQPPSPNLAAPSIDIDNQARPALGGFDSGADEFPGAQADLSITKTDGVASVTPGTIVRYTISVANAGPASALLAPVTDTVPATLTGVTWTCVAAAGSSCGVASGTGTITTTVSLAVGGSATFTLNGTVAATAAGTLSNTATVATPAGTADPITANNASTDTDTIILPRPVLGLLDNFNRTNAANLSTGAPAGVSWSQATTALTVLRVNANQANCALVGNCLAGQAIWNGTTNIFGTKQGAAFTFVQNAGAPAAPVTASSLLLKVVNGAGSATNPANYIRVQYQTTAGGQVLVQTTTTGNNLIPSFTTIGTLPSGAFATGDTLTAVANADGSVDAWRTTAASVTTYLGRTLTSAFTGTGRIGFQVLMTSRIDNFSGGTVTP